MILIDIEDPIVLDIICGIWRFQNTVETAYFHMILRFDAENLITGFNAVQFQLVDIGCMVLPLPKIQRISAAANQCKMVIEKGQ